MANTVVGFFDSAEDAQNAVQTLVQEGFERNSIDVSSGYSDMTGSGNENRSSDRSSEGGNAISRFFHSLFGGDTEEAQRYSSVGSRSKAIVTVHAQSSDEAEQAADILDEAGAINVDEKSSSEPYSSAQSSRANQNSSYGMSDAGTGMSDMGSGITDTGMDRAGTTAGVFNSGSNLSERGTSDETNKIDRVEEELQVGKRTVETGGVRVRSRIIERPVEEHLRLREERVSVDRNPVDRTLSADEYDAFQEKNIELTEHAEVPVVNKEARVVEEIRINKESSERDETVRDSVRKTEVDVEDTGSKNISSDSNRWTDSDRTGSDHTI